MKKVKVRLIGEGTEENPYTVDLPTWMMEGNPDYTKKECYVLLLDDEVKIVGGKNKINQDKIRKKYKKNWSNFDSTTVELEK